MRAIDLAGALLGNGFTVLATKEPLDVRAVCRIVLDRLGGRTLKVYPFGFGLRHGIKEDLDYSVVIPRSRLGGSFATSAALSKRSLPTESYGCFDNALTV